MQTRGTATEIKNITIYIDRNEDYWFCKHTKDGAFNLKMCIKILRGNLPKLEWTRVVWKHITCSKMRLCLYRAIIDILPPKLRQNNQHINVDPKCIFALHMRRILIIYFFIVCSHYLFGYGAS